MGIPLYFKTLVTDYPEIVIKNIDGKNCLFLDLNCAIHPCCRKIMSEMDYSFFKKDLMEMRMIQAVIAYIKKLVDLSQPELLYVAIDGVVPIAKMLQQRTRRFKSQLDKKNEIKIRERCNMPIDSVDTWDTNAISPGTEFMNKLNSELEVFLKSYNAVEKIVFNSSSLPGEGEHKILNFIKENSESLESMNKVIYGLDADLIMLSMVSGVENVYLLREEIEFKKGGSSVSQDHFLYMDIGLLKMRLSENIKLEYSKLDPLFIFDETILNNTSKESRERGNFIDDYIFFCFLFGNDFVPHTPSLDLRNGGHEVLMSTYIKSRHRLNEHFIIKGKINTAFLIYFLDNLSECENTLLIKLEKSRSKFNIKRFVFSNEYEKENGILNNYPMIHREKEKKIDAGKIGWKARYYYYALNIDPNDYSDRDAVVKSYLDILKWTFDYYFHGNVSYYVGFPYAYGPPIDDIVKYLRKTNIEMKNISFKKGNTYNSLTQLLYILPESSRNLLPKNARELMTSTNSLIRHYYPDEFKLNTCYKRYFWQCTPVLPCIDIELLKNVTKTVKLSVNEKKRYTRGKLLVF